VVKIGLVCSVAFLLLGAFAVAGATVSLAWYPSADTNVAGYSLFYGPASRQYTTCQDAGTNTSISVSGLADGQTYYFATATYNSSGAVSPYSNEVSNSIPASSILPTLVTTPIPSPKHLFLTKKTRSTPKTWQNLAASTAAAVSAGDISRQPAAVPALAARAGVYNGLFYQTDTAGAPAMTEATTGFLGNCVIKTNGHFSARLACGGRFYSFSGTFSASGEGIAVVCRSNAALPNLSIALYLESALGTGRMTGVVSNMDTDDSWVAPLTASLATNAYAPAAKYFFLSPPAAAQFGGGPDPCMSELTVAPNGVVSLLGRLGDGTPMSQTVAIAGDGNFPIYVCLYHQAGLLAGWVNLAGGAPTGSLTWIRPALPSQGQPDLEAFTHVLRFATAPDSSSTSLRLSQ